MSVEQWRRRESNIPEAYSSCEQSVRNQTHDVVNLLRLDCLIEDEENCTRVSIRFGLHNFVLEILYWIQNTMLEGRTGSILRRCFPGFIEVDEFQELADYAACTAMPQIDTANNIHRTQIIGDYATHHNSESSPQVAVSRNVLISSTILYLLWTVPGLYQRWTHHLRYFATSVQCVFS